MTSRSGTSRGWSIPIQEAIPMIQDWESDTGGLLSDEESDLDQQLYNMDENQRKVLHWSSMRLALHVVRVKNVVFKGQVFVVWIDLPAIKTCILVEIDLQVYIFARKVRFTGPKVYFFSYFVVCSMGRVSHVGTRRFSWWCELCMFLLGNAIRSHFFPSNAGVTIFFFLTEL